MDYFVNVLLNMLGMYVLLYLICVFTYTHRSLWWDDIVDPHPTRQAQALHLTIILYGLIEVIAKVYALIYSWI